MNKIWISIILIMSLMGFASALDGSGVDYGIDSTYSQYYSIYNGPATAKHIGAPQQYVIGVTPTTVYLGSQMQAVPYPQYYATYTGGNSLWIQGSTSWTQYAQVPQGSTLSLLALSPTGGEGSLYETYPDGKVIRSDFYFYPTSNIGFYADTPGRHVLSFILAGQPSNQVTIDVVSTYKPPVYYAQPAYYSGYSPYHWDWDYYPYYWDSGDHHQDDKDHHDGPPPHDGSDDGQHPPPLPPLDGGQGDFQPPGQGWPLSEGQQEIGQSVISLLGDLNDGPPPIDGSGDGQHPPPLPPLDGGQGGFQPPGDHQQPLGQGWPLGDGQQEIDQSVISLLGDLHDSGSGESSRPIRVGKDTGRNR
jgi:hypothetical protein